MWRFAPVENVVFQINTEQICEVKLPIFEGPFDLLLYFIERDKIPVSDIPIAKITGEFLNYIDYLRQNSLEVGSEFIQMAALLIKIKAKFLIPQVRKAIEENREEDPRKELTQKLVEYKKFKKLSQELEKLLEESTENLPVGHIPLIKKFLLPPEDIYSLKAEPYSLLKVFVSLMKKHKRRQYKHPSVLKPFSYSVPQIKEWIDKSLIPGRKYSFLKLIEYEPNREFVIVLFLAVLDYIQIGKLKLYYVSGAEDFFVEPVRK